MRNIYIELQVNDEIMEKVERKILTGRIMPGQFKVLKIYVN